MDANVSGSSAVDLQHRRTRGRKRECVRGKGSNGQ